MPRSRVFACSYLLLACPSAPAEILPTLPLRDLTIRADVVVVAAPADPVRPGRFRVRELLKGTTQRSGMEIEVAGLDACIRPKEPPDWARVDAVLLFLQATQEGRLEAIESGVRLRLSDGSVWWPVQPHNPGGYQMLQEPGISWDAVLLRVRADAAEVTRLQMACDLADVDRRDRLLLDWIERRRHEFSDGRGLSWIELSPAVRNLGPEEMRRSDADANGWGDLQLLPFQRVLQGRVPADCWRAVNLYAELNRNSFPPGAAAAFASRQGRAWLLALASNSQLLDGYRARALRLLADPGVDQSNPIDGRERVDLLDQLLPVLRDRNPACRGLAARVIQRAVASDSAGSERAADALRQAYKKEKPGPARNCLAEALYELLGRSARAELSGRADGSLALLRDLALREDKCVFWLTLKTDEALILKQAPTLFLERLDSKGAVAETKKMSLTLPPQGWNGGPLHMELTHTDLKPGTWRLRVTGKNRKETWESEPRTIRIDEPAGAQPQPAPSTLNRLLRSVRGLPPPRVVAEPKEPSRRTIDLDGEAF